MIFTGWLFLYFLYRQKIFLRVLTNDRDGVTRTPDFGVRGSSLATSTTRRRKRLPPGLPT